MKTALGFTLLELLVATALTLLLAGLILAVTTGALNLWRRSQDDFTTSAQAKLALDLIEQDLHSAVFRREGTAWLAADVIESSGTLTIHGWLSASIMKPATESRRLLGNGDLGSARFGLSGVWLRFIGTGADSDGSVPVAISYQIARRPVSGAVSATNPADVRYTLFRAAVTAAGSFASGNDVTAAAYGSSSATPTISRAPATLTNPNSADALASNVVDFGVWFYVRDNTGALRRIFPANDSDLSHRVSDTGAASDANRMPEVIDVAMRVLTEEGASLIAAMEQGSGSLIRPAAYASDAEWWWAVVETHSRVFMRRIEIKATPL